MPPDAAICSRKKRMRNFSPACLPLFLHAKTAPELISGAARLRWICPLVPRVPEDHVAAFLAFHGGEVRVDLARADLRVCERDRDIFAA